jgi:hypothetical protein
MLMMHLCQALIPRMALFLVLTPYPNFNQGSLGGMWM